MFCLICFLGFGSTPAATAAGGFGTTSLGFGNTSLFGGNKLGTGTTPAFGGFGSTGGLFNYFDNI